LAIAREDAGEHADGSLQDGDDGQHGRHAKGDARHTDEGSNSVPQQIGNNQLEKDHAAPCREIWLERWQALSMRSRASASN